MSHRHLRGICRLLRIEIIPLILDPRQVHVFAKNQSAERNSILRIYLAGLHLPKKRFSFAVFFFFFLLTQAEEKGFQPVTSLYFYVGQQKKNALKEPVKRTSILRHVNRLIRS